MVVLSPLSRNVLQLTPTDGSPFGRMLVFLYTLAKQLQIVTYIDKNC